ncbi:MAG TPA: Rieske 2Fe-2S domain-containing protein [Vicinamibacterales bacterium]|nr:Rieske 2Fe-2S domain-containing protein [Vicinamibacterales bacterium]
MKIVVVGGSGLIGSKLVTMLTRGGHEVVAASRRSGVDAITGEGLAEALRGAAVVVDVSNSPSFEDATVMKFFKAATHNLLTAEASVGIRHHVAVSVVGTGRLLGSGYLRAKLAQEKLIKESSILYSIIQATQFFEFLTNIADAATHGTAVRVPPVHVQPVAADDVARTVAKIATGSPLNGTVEIGGPEPFYLDGLLQRVLGARNDRREVIADAHARYFGAELNERSLLPGDEAVLGEIRFDDWLGRTAHPIPNSNVQPAVAAGAGSERAQLEENEFRVSEVPPGSVLLVGDCAVFNIEGGFCATQALCTHRQGALSEGSLDGTTVTCPLHGAQFNVWTGAVLRGPAKDPLETYRVTVDGDIGRVEVPIAHAVHGA